MGLREWANRHPKAVGGIAAACVVILASGVAVEVLGNRRAIQSTVPDSYYTIDDGKTYFAVSGSNIAPFDYEGKTAVRAAVFDCGGHRFVGFLDRYKPEARNVILAGKGIPAWIDVKGREVKRPGDPSWVSADNAKEANRIMTVGCPDGSGGTPELVEP